MIPFPNLQRIVREMNKDNHGMIRLLSSEDRRRFRRELNSKQKKEEKTPHPEEHNIHFVASSRMLWDEQNSMLACPVNAQFDGKKKSRFAIVSHNDFEEFTYWLESYGCNWQEI